MNVLVGENTDFMSTLSKIPTETEQVTARLKTQNQQTFYFELNLSGLFEADSGLCFPVIFCQLYVRRPTADYF